MSMNMSLFRLPDELAERLVAEAGLAEQVVDDPAAHGLKDHDVAADFNYRDFAPLMNRRHPWLSQALDQEHSTQVGEDFGYGPGTLFNAREVARLANGLRAEWPDAEDPVDEFVAFFDGAARAKQAILVIVS